MLSYANVISSFGVHLDFLEALDSKDSIRFCDAEAQKFFILEICCFYLETSFTNSAVVL